MTLGGKIAGGLIILVLATVLVPGAIFHAQLESRLDDLEALAAAELDAALERRLAELEAALERGVARLAADVAADGPFLAVALSDAVRTPPVEIAPHVRARTATLLAHADLDLLWLVARDGRVLSCGHWPARAGARRPDLRLAPPGRAQFAWERVRNEEWPVLRLAEPVVSGGAGLRLVGGLRLDQAVRRLGMGEGLSLALFDAAGALVAARPWPPALAELPAALRREAQAGGERVALRAASRDGAPWLLSARPLLEADGAGALLVAGRSLEDLGGMRRRLLLTLITLGLAALGLAAAAGVLLGRRLAAPVRVLTAGTERMARGELDQDLPVRSRDEVGRLTASFNRMAEAIRHSRRELARSERLAAWRDAARRMAHEVKNPLAPIRMSVENLRRARAAAPERFAAMFEDECRTILEEVDALRRLVDEFSRFARLPEPRRRPTDPAALVRHAADLYAPSLSGAAISVVVEPGLPPAALDPELMGQVLKNLLANALDAAPRPGGRVGMEVRRRGDELVISVTDNGPGIPRAVRERLFEPTITTKRAGSGLGLAVSRQIVERHGGRIEFETASTGTAFHVLLPLQAQP